MAQQIAAGDARITGLMIEPPAGRPPGDIVPGQALQHGVSVTDACISLAQTMPVLEGLARAVRTRRLAAPETRRPPAALDAPDPSQDNGVGHGGVALFRAPGVNFPPLC